MKVVPLGTSSGKPTLTRNVSATAVTREREWLLFDCGEGTQMQMARAGLAPSRLSAVFITHLHGDHFNGLAGLLSTMGLDRREKRLDLIGPPGIVEYLDTLRRLSILFVNFPLEVREFGEADFRDPVAVVEGGGSSDGRTGDTPQLAPGSAVVYRGDYYSVTAQPLDHRIFAIGYRIEEERRPGRFDVAKAMALGVPEGRSFGVLQSGRPLRLPDGRTVEPSQVMGPPRRGKSLAYCTDTRPCAAVVQLARAVDLLVHEATYAEEMVGEAAEYGHSTAAQAARTARRAGARRLLLTHFSARYPDAARLLEEAQKVFPESSLAEELAGVEV